MHDGPARRPYRSPLREEQARATRERIVQALVEQVTEDGLADFSVPEVARRAGVSVRTVYRHFPTRDDLLAAVEGWLEERPSPPQPRDLDDFGRFVRELYGWFEADAPYHEALLATRLGRRVRRGPARRRTRRVLDLSAGWTWLEPADRRRLGLLLRLLGSSATWKTLRDDCGLDAAEAGELAAWIVERVVRDLEGRPEPQEEP